MLESAIKTHNDQPPVTVSCDDVTSSESNEQSVFTPNAAAVKETQ